MWSSCSSEILSKPTRERSTLFPPLARKCLFFAAGASLAMEDPLRISMEIMLLKELPWPWKSTDLV